jgi:hypothetical protein
MTRGLDHQDERSADCFGGMLYADVIKGVTTALVTFVRWRECSQNRVVDSTRRTEFLYAVCFQTGSGLPNSLHAYRIVFAPSLLSKCHFGPSWRGADRRLSAEWSDGLCACSTKNSSTNISETEFWAQPCGEVQTHGATQTHGVSSRPRGFALLRVKSLGCALATSHTCWKNPGQSAVKPAAQERASRQRPNIPQNSFGAKRLH